MSFLFASQQRRFHSGLEDDEEREEAMGLEDSAYVGNQSVTMDSGTEAYAASLKQLVFLITQTRTLLETVTHQQHGTRTKQYRVVYPPKNPYILVVDSDCHEDASTMSQRLLSRMTETQFHLERLQTRIADTHSRVLVTGDLNAGKSTFINALLRRPVAPDDQQPCTSLFVEFTDCVTREEVHGIVDPASYDSNDALTFTRHQLSDLRGLVEDNATGYAMLKVFCREARPSSQSLLRNGIIDMSLIDSPGLNIDSVKTTALFAKQEEIDVIVFVVNAENHLTLSARQFLQAACKEKAYVFIVVNRFDMIRRKEKCRQDILEQIASISATTFGESDDLVHFVSARQAFLAHQHSAVDSAEFALPPAEAVARFEALELQLRRFILEKRSRSKLSPARVFLGHLLADIADVSKHNAEYYQREAVRLAVKLQDSMPTLQRMLSLKEHVLNDIERTIHRTGSLVEENTRKELSDFIAEIEPFSDGVEWPGIFNMLQYAHNLRQVIFRLATVRVRRCGDFARDHCVSCIKNVEHLASGVMAVPPHISLDEINSVFSHSSKVVVSPEDVVLQMSDLVDMSDKVEIAKSYAPSFALMTCGLLGYRGFTSSLFRMSQSIGISRMVRLSFAGIGLAGKSFHWLLNIFIPF